jgi:hypothetical protein
MVIDVDVHVALRRHLLHADPTISVPIHLVDAQTHVPVLVMMVGMFANRMKIERCRTPGG